MYNMKEKSEIPNKEIQNIFDGFTSSTDEITIKSSQFQCLHKYYGESQYMIIGNKLVCKMCKFTIEFESEDDATKYYQIINNKGED